MNGREEYAPGCFRSPMNECGPIPAVGHMPFPGHRSQAQILAIQAARRKHFAAMARRAEEYGFDPDSLKEAGE